MRLLLADDEPLVLDGLRTTLEQEYHPVAIIDTVPDVLPAVESLHPGLLLLGFFRNHRGAECWRILSLLQTHLPTARVLIRAPHDDPHLEWAAIRLGASGLVTAVAPADTVRRSLSAVRSGNQWFGGRQNAGKLLTRRQLEVLQTVATGRTHKSVAAALGLSISAVDHHLSRARTRLGAASRDQLLVLAAERSLLGLDPRLFDTREGREAEEGNPAPDRQAPRAGGRDRASGPPRAP